MKNRDRAVPTAQPTARERRNSSRGLGKTLRLLPSTPELDIFADMQARSHRWHQPDPDTAKKISAILDQLRREIPPTAPAAKRLAKNTRIYISENLGTGNMQRNRHHLPDRIFG